jgi:hypothetical protein
MLHGTYADITEELLEIRKHHSLLNKEGELI